MIVYLDNHSTTRTDPGVVEAMMPYLTDRYGNPSSRAHAPGVEAQAAVDNARDLVASLIGALPANIVFTSGATESINLALKGTAEALSSRGTHIITTAAEHSAVLKTLDHLRSYGFDVTVLPVDRNGCVGPSDIDRAMQRDTILVSVILASNEIGSFNPIREIAELCRRRGIMLHCDGAQAIGKTRLDVGTLGIDLLSMSAHKMHGPKGVGALAVMSQVKPSALLDGGGQEAGMRSGTQNVAGIVGFGEAARIAAMEVEAEEVRIAGLRDHFEGILRDRIPSLRFNGNSRHRLCTNSSITIDGVPANRLVSALKDVVISTGSACSSGEPGPSHVLKAIGLSDEEARSTIRCGLSRFTTAGEIEYAAFRISDEARRIRNYPNERTHVEGEPHEASPAY